jgi:RNA polymerase sigma-70 factor (ECF subfamily)
MLNHAVLDQAYRRYSGALQRDVQARVSDPQIAAELVQETFLRAHRFSHLYNPEHALSTWIWAIANRTVADYLRGAGGRRPGEVEYQELPCPRSHAEDLLITKHSRRESLRQLKRLTRTQRKVVLMRAFRHLSYREIARRLGMSLNAVKALSQRAKQVLL